MAVTIDDWEILHILHGKELIDKSKVQKIKKRAHEK